MKHKIIKKPGEQPEVYLIITYTLKTQRKSHIETGKKGRDTMQVGLASHEAIEHWEGECGCRGTSEGTRGPSPMQGPPSSGFQSWEKESPQNLTIKFSGDSNCEGESEGIWQPRQPLKGPEHRLTHLQVIKQAFTGRTAAAQELPEPYKESKNELFSFRVRNRGTAAINPV